MKRVKKQLIKKNKILGLRRVQSNHKNLKPGDAGSFQSRCNGFKTSAFDESLSGQEKHVDEAFVSSGGTELLADLDCSKDLSDKKYVAPGELPGVGAVVCNKSTISFMEDDGNASVCKTATSCEEKRNKVLSHETFLEFSQRLARLSVEKHNSGLCLNPALLERLSVEGFTAMTRIQRQTIPVLLTGVDVLLRSETGSGKTLAFLVPVLQNLIRMDSEQPLTRSLGTRVLLLAPTRELVNQTITVAMRLTTPFPRIVVGSITGGEKRKSEKARLRRGIIFLGATVGRICDHLDTTQSFVISNLSTFILDEADRLLDMGFEKKIRWIVNTVKRSREELNSTQEHIQCSGNRQEGLSGQLSDPKRQLRGKPHQTILVSATLTPTVEKLAEFVLRKTECSRIGVSRDDSFHDNTETSDAGILKNKTPPVVLAIPPQVVQIYTRVTLKTRLALLVSLLCDKLRSNTKIVVFFSNCDSVEFHHALLQVVRWPNETVFTRNHSLRNPRRTANTPSSLFTLDSMDVFDSDASTERGMTHTSVPDFAKNEGKDDKSRTEQRRIELQNVLGDHIFGSSTRFFKLHGSLSQTDRLGFLKNFNQCTSSAVLSTTDVAARGLNLEGVSFVIQCDPPQELEEYVHRVGRTGRIDRKGTALLFLLDHENGYVDYLKRGGVSLALRPELELFQPLIQELLPLCLRKRRLQNVATFLTSFFTRQVEADIDLLHLARRAFSASYRAYRCYAKELKPFFNTRSLHLGHLATAFGLSESPSLIGEKCRQGAVAAAKRQLLRNGRTQQFSGDDALPIRSKRPMLNKRFAAVGDGLLHNARKGQPLLQKVSQIAKLDPKYSGFKPTKKVKQEIRAERSGSITAPSTVNKAFGNDSLKKQRAIAVEQKPRSSGSRRVGRILTSSEKATPQRSDPVAAALAKLREIRDILN